MSAKTLSGSKEEAVAREEEQYYPPVAPPPLLKLFNEDDALWAVWAAIVLVPLSCGLLMLAGLRYDALWRTCGIFLTLGAALTFATYLVPGTRSNLSNETVLITGGTTGIGLELGRQLLRRGAKVVTFTDKAPEQDPAGIAVIVCDVSDRDAVRRAAEEMRRLYGHPTVVVNNAGVQKGKLILDLTEADVKSTFGVNSLAQFWMVQEFLPEMVLRRRGHIVNISSVLGLVGVAQLADYCASKAASVAFHASLRNELDYRYDSPEIRTTLVLPGHVRTTLFQDTVLPGSWLLRLAVPSLTPEAVAKSIVNAIAGNKRNTVIRAPWFTQSARLLGTASSLMPGPVLRLSHWVSGADWAMRTYGPSPDAGQILIRERTEAEYRAADQDDAASEAST